MYERQRLKRGIRDISHLFASRAAEPGPSRPPGKIQNSTASPIKPHGLEDRPLIGLAVAPVGDLDLEIALAIGRGLSRRFESLTLVYPEHESAHDMTLAQLSDHVPPASISGSQGTHLIHLGSRLKFLVPGSILPDPLIPTRPEMDRHPVNTGGYKKHLQPIMICLNNNSIESWGRLVPVCDQLILVLPPREEDFMNVRDWLKSMGPTGQERIFYWVMAGRFPSPASRERLDMIWKEMMLESLGYHVHLLGSLNRGKWEKSAGHHELRLDLVEPGILSMLGELGRSRTSVQDRSVILEWAAGLPGIHAENLETQKTETLPRAHQGRLKKMN
jgi:hypothetical protein